MAFPYRTTAGVAATKAVLFTLSVPLPWHIWKASTSRACDHKAALPS